MALRHDWLFCCSAILGLPIIIAERSNSRQRTGRYSREIVFAGRYCSEATVRENFRFLIDFPSIWFPTSRPYTSASRNQIVRLPLPLPNAPLNAMMSDTSDTVSGHRTARSVLKSDQRISVYASQYHKTANIPLRGRNPGSAADCYGLYCLGWTQ